MSKFNSRERSNDIIKGQIKLEKLYQRRLNKIKNKAERKAALKKSNNTIQELKNKILNKK